MKSNSLLHLLTSTLVLFLVSPFCAGQSFQRTIYHGPPAPDVVAADVNQDGKPDLLTPETDEEGEGLIFLNHGDGTFPDGGSKTISNIGLPATRVVAADFNGDGITGLVMESCSSGGLSIILFAGDGRQRLLAKPFCPQELLQRLHQNVRCPSVSDRSLAGYASRVTSFGFIVRGHSRGSLIAQTIGFAAIHV